MPGKDIHFQTPEEIVSNSRAKVDKYYSRNRPENNLSPELEHMKSVMSGDAHRDRFFTSAETIDVNTNFTRLNSGEYIPKYENIAGNYGNENRLALQQTTGEKWANGLTKFVGKVGTYAADATVGTIYGLYKGITEGSLEAVWNNEFSQGIDDLNTQMDGSLPNYVSDAEKNMSVWESLGTANFWANDFSNGLAFVGANLLSGKISSVATGSFKFATKVPQLSLKLGGKTTAKQILKQGDNIAKMGAKSSDDIAKFGLEGAGDLAKFNKALGNAEVDELIQLTNKKILRSTSLGKVGKGLDITAFSVRTGTFEAGLEARTNFNEAFDTFVSDYRENHNGEAPSFEEIKEFKEDATHAANWLFAGNMAILAPSNIAMFGKASGISLNTSKRVNSYVNKNLFGKGVNYSKKGGTITATALEANKVQKNLARTHAIFGKAATEGLYEEGFQGVAGKTMQHYLESKYNPNAVGQGVSLWASIYESFGEQYGSNEGWKEMFIGSLIGGFGAPALISSSQGKPGQFFKDVGQNISQSATKESNEATANAYNNAYLGMQKKLSAQASLINSTNAQSNLTQGINMDGSASDASVDYNDALRAESQSNYDYISVMEGNMTDSQIQEDYDFLVSNLDRSQTNIDQSATEEQFEEYKDELKNKFAENLVSTRQAKDAAEALGLGSFIDSKGDTREATDVIARTIYDGIEALPHAKRVAEQLDQALGEDGMFSVLNMMNNLTEEGQGLTIEFSKLKEDKKRNTKLAFELQKRLTDQATRTRQVGLGDNKSGTTRSQQALDRKTQEYQKTSEALAKINNEIIDIDNRLTEISEQFETISKVENTGLSNTYGETSEGLLGFDIEQALDKLEKLDKFTNHLRATDKQRDADLIDQLTKDFIGFATQARSLQSLHREMLDPQFFKRKKGKTMLTDIIGRKYKMSEELKTQLDENNARVIDVLDKKGMLKHTEAPHLKTLVEDNIVNNDKLSEREKFRMENILKAQMLQLNILNTALVAEEIEDTGKVRPKNVVKGGDSVRFSNELNSILKDETITNAEQVDRLIDTIIKQVNKIFDVEGRAVTASDIKVLEKKHNVTIEKNVDGSYFVQPVIGEIQEVTEEIAKEFEDTGKVSDEVLNTIAVKVKDRTELTTQEKDIKAAFSSEINAKLEGVPLAEAELETIANPGFVIFTDEKVKRLETLIKKQVKEEELTEEELQELEQLQTEFDRWTLAEGTVENGVRLSDLIRRRENYRNLSVSVQDDVFNLEGSEAMSLSEFEHRGTDNYYFLAQSPINATVIKQDEGISIQNVSAGELAGVMGAKVDVQDPMPNTQVEFTIGTEGGESNIVANIDQKGNLIFSEEDIAIINENTNLIVTPTNEELSTRYSVLLQKDSKGVIRPVQSDYNYQGEEISPEAIYDLKKGEQLKVVVDPQDEYNQKLLNSITETVTPTVNAVNKETKKRLKKNTAYNEALSDIEGFTDKSTRYKEAVEVESAIRNEVIAQVVKDLTKIKIKKLTAEYETMLINSMVVKLYKVSNVDGKPISTLVGVMKGVSNNANLSPRDQRFEMARQSIIGDNLAKLLDGSNDFFEATEVDVTASDVFLGHPNYNFTDSGEVLSTQFKDVAAHNVDKIVDVGFMENKEVTLKNKTKDVDTTYLSKLKGKKGKQPIIVIEFAGKQVAYPANVKNRDKTAIVDEIESLLYSKLPMVQKGMEVDKKLAQLGIDPNVPGNSLEYFSNTNNNFSDENIQNFLGNVKETPYIYSLEKWFGENNDGTAIEEIVSEQIQVNINLDSPFHSPKFKMEFPRIEAQKPTKQDQKDNNSTTKKQSASSSLETQQAADALNC